MKRLSKKKHDIPDIIKIDDSDETEASGSSGIARFRTPTSKGQTSMFNWVENLTSMPQYQCTSKDTLSGSTFPEEVPAEVCSKKQRMTANLTSLDDDYDNDNLITLDDSMRESSPPRVQKEETIAGVKVKFPANPYSCQKAVMSTLIRGCTKQENCLIESPTGSGKTLALLCGSLAWQSHYCESIARMDDDQDKWEDDASAVENICCGKDDASSNSFFDDQSCDKVSSKTTQRLPKIFYLTRTHSQIEQVVRELKKTAYRDKRMTILSSREHTCIQETNRNKTELCNELLDPKKHVKCPYFNEQNKKAMASFETMKCLGLETPWDIEDLVSLGKQIKACPYFGARSLMADAEIIMCPYSYIVNPHIRMNMQINVKDHIVIFDEAHNIEDVCRENASVSIKSDKLANAAKECGDLFYMPYANKHVFNIIRTYLDDVVRFLDNIDVKRDSNDGKNEMVSKPWLGTEFLELLNIDEIGRSRFPVFLVASNAAIKDFNDSREIRSERTIIPTISFETKAVLENLCFAMQMIMSEIFVNDYRAYVIETEEYYQAPNAKAHGNWISRNKQQRIRTLELVCMNPAVVFAPMAQDARSVILASGTLSPIASFESELGTQFPHKLHANHIIPKEQVYVRCIPRGPNNISLKAVYNSVISWSFQDELGKLILQVCDSVPHGILCFFSSYSIMEQIHKRWKNTGTWEKLEKLKEVCVEPKYNKNLYKVMEKYREEIEKSSSESFRNSEKSGAILFAVFRAKVAEGIDFKDNEARCVLTVGIPYKSTKDTAVSMKREYNDSNVSKGLLSGSEWYTIDAFRALNQALGRCIRHINDWGAILLVEQRLLEPKNFETLPKWIKEMWINDKNENLKMELENFVSRQVAREKGKMYLEKKGKTYLDEEGKMYVDEKGKWKGPYKI